MYSATDLSALVAREFSFLLEQGWAVTSDEIVAPEDSRGGFRLRFRRDQFEIVVSYLDMELDVTFNGVEVFGPSVHPKFSGNVFSPAHLSEYLPGLVAVIEAELASRVRRAV